jgi:hypothetical protein
MNSSTILPESIIDRAAIAALTLHTPEKSKTTSLLFIVPSYIDNNACVLTLVMIIEFLSGSISSSVGQIIPIILVLHLPHISGAASLGTFKLTKNQGLTAGDGHVYNK